MFLKRQIIIALDDYENQYEPELLGTHRDYGIKRNDFIHWFQHQKTESKKFHSAGLINKCLEDCIDDGYIKSVLVQDKPYVANTYDESGFLVTGQKLKYLQVENISISSKGRELKYWYFFWPAMLEKMSVKELAFFAITTGITILLAYLGIKGFTG